MFDLSFMELLVVAVVALLVVGPQKLPEVARTAGRWIGAARRMVDEVKREVNAHIEEMDAHVKDVDAQVKDMGAQIKGDALASGDKTQDSKPSLEKSESGQK